MNEIQCAQDVRDRLGNWPRPHPCASNASFNEDGKWWCGLHGVALGHGDMG